MSDGKIPYTGRDADDIREELIDKIPELTDKWTDYHDSDIGIALIQLMAYLGDSISYNIDRMANEAFLTRAQERGNVRAHLRGKGYKMSGYVSSQALVKFRTEYPQDIIIPKYFQLETEEDPTGEVLKFATIEEGNLRSESYVELECMQGEVVEEEFEFDDISEEGMIELPDDNIGENTFEVIVDGNEWEMVDDARFHPDPGQYFSIEYDKEDNIHLSLHPSWSNFVSNRRDVEIEVTYLLSEGSDGNIGRGMITKPAEELEVNGEDVADTLIINNEESSFGGRDPESIERAKKHGIDMAKTMWSAVLLEDFEILAREVDGVANALALDWKYEGEGEEDPDSDIEPPEEPYITDLYIVTNDLEPMEDLLKDRIEDYLDERRIATTEINIYDAHFYEVDISAEIDIISDRIKDSIINKVEEDLEDYFAPFNRRFSGRIRRVDVQDLIESAHDDIITALLTEPETNIDIPFGNFPVLGSVDIDVV